MVFPVFSGFLSLISGWGVYTSLLVGDRLGNGFTPRGGLIKINVFTEGEK